jgi:hypothetical protein
MLFANLFHILILSLIIKGSNSAHDEEKLTQFLEYMMTSGKVLDGTVAAETSKIQVHVVQ